MTDRLLAVLAACSLWAPSLAYAQQVEYYHLDGLGSVRAVTDEQGEVLERHDYLPFGEGWNPEPGSQPRKFTGKERDEETGWDYFGARYYEASLARFTAIDPVTTFDENRADPQGWNRYAYVRNNPLRYVDPDGKVLETAWDALNIGIGVASLVSNLQEGNYLSAAVDAGGVALDSAAAAVPFVPGGFGSLIKGARAADKATDFVRSARAATGQVHHAIPRRVHRALERHPNLSGQYRARDRRFELRAADGDAHRGYQRWHRDLDEEVVDWVNRNPDATPEQFEKYLHGTYSRPDLAERFPKGIQPRENS